MTIPPARLTGSNAYRQAAEVTAVELSGIGALDLRVVGLTQTGGGTVAIVAAESAIRVQCSTASGDVARIETHRKPRPAYGRARRTRVVGHVSAAVTSQLKRWGVFDANDGLFFELDGETLSVVRRSSISGAPVDARVANGQWTEAAAAIDTTRTHVYEIRECWPNGDVHWLVDDVLVHITSTAAAITGAGTQRARLPLAVETSNASATSAGSFKMLDGAVYVEEMPPHVATRALLVSDAAVDGTGQALCSIRPKATAGGGELQPKRLDVVTSGDAHVQLYAGATVADGSWAAHDASSLAESNATTVALPGTGVIVDACAVNGARSFDLIGIAPAVLLADGTQDTLTVVATSLTGGSITVRVALSWEETR